MTLYELTGQYLYLLEMMDDPDLDEEALIDTLDSIDGEIEDKADNYAKIISEMSKRAEAISAEIRRLQERKKTIENNIERLKANLQASMVVTGKRKFKTDLFSFSIQKNGGAPPVIIDADVEDIPDDLLIITKSPNKKAIAEAIQSDPSITFAHFGDRGESLRIR